MERREQARYGKWSQGGVPHRGWSCIRTEDLGEPLQTCMMCEHAEIRYVHIMEHPEYFGTLEVGCICAGRMENDYVNPRRRERKLASEARRRHSWSRRKWRTSARGNFYLNTDGFNLTVFRKTDRRGSCWAILVTHRGSETSQWGHRRYESVDKAKQAALDALLWAKKHLSG